MKRVLIIKMWALGDLLMATPMLASLRTRYPGIEITWLADSTHAELLEGHPRIDDLIALDSASWRHPLRKGKVVTWLSRSLALRRDMRERNFDAVINCHPDKGWSAILCAAPVRVGLYPIDKLPATRRFYTHALRRPKSPPLHNTEHYLLATRALGCPDADLRMTVGETPDEAVFLRRFEREQGVNPSLPLVVLAPFSTGENRCWEPERYAALADWLHRTYGAQIVMTLGPNDARQAETIAAASQAPLVAARGTTLRQYVALLRRADLVISSDSSPMHIAAAVRTPYIALFGPTPIAERAPMAGRGMALAKPLHCAPCDSPRCVNPVFRQCMKLLEVADVQAAVARLLETPVHDRKGRSGDGAVL